MDEELYLGKGFEPETKHMLIGFGFPILSIPVTFIIQEILDFCKFDFGSGCNEVSDDVFSFFFFLPFLFSITMIFYSIRIEEKSFKKWAKRSAMVTFLYGAAMEYFMLVALQTI